MKQSRISMIIKELNHFGKPENRRYLGDCVNNIARIVFGYMPIDYEVISHENQVVGSIIPSLDKTYR
ncbi:MAG: hypothetical protein WC533_02700 [Candidatus Pacearchaeota archaeon]